MKHWIILCIFCLDCQTAVGQLKGSYISNAALDTKVLHFSDTNKFRYVRLMCYNVIIGEGSYTLQNGELLLTFEKDSIKKSYFRTTTIPLKNETSKLYITALDGVLQDTLIGTNIILKDKEGKVFKSQVLGSEGYVEIDLPTSAKTFYLEVVGIGFEPLACPITPQQDYQVEAVIFYNFTSTIEAGKQMKFDIKVHKKYIELKEKNNPNASFEWFEKQKE